MRLRFLLLSAGLLCLASMAMAQRQPARPARPDEIADTLQNEGDTLYFDTFMELVYAGHPLIRRAQLLPAFAAAELRIARGGFDPKLGASFREKEQKGTHYYSVLESYVKIPVWIGELSAGFEQGQGQFINPENFTSQGGLLYAGISIPIMRDLVLDERRTALRQAQLLGELNDAEQLSTINKLLLSAIKAYWDWQAATQQAAYLRVGLDLADFRYQGVIERVANGYEAPIDTVEAHLEVLKRQAMLVDAELSAQIAALRLSSFLWSPDGQPLELRDSIMPQQSQLNLPPFEQALPDSLKDIAWQFHPDLRKLQIKQQQLGFEARLWRQRVLPDVRLEFKPLLEAQGGQLNGQVLSENYKFGLTASFPIFLRKERGKRRQVELKLQDLGYMETQLGRDILIGIDMGYRQLLASESLLSIQEQSVDNALQLQVGETEKFFQGESTLFLVNRRERTALEAQLKLAELRAKLIKAYYELLWQAGVPLAP